MEENIMPLDELIKSGWARHAEDPEGVAQELESHKEAIGEAGQAAAFLGLANHTIGEHLGDWRRAQRLADQIMTEPPHSPEMGGALLCLALAHLMAGDWPEALALAALITASGHESGAVVQIKLSMQAAKALFSARETARGAHLFRSALDLARARHEPSADRTVAVLCSNLASDLLERPERSADETGVMQSAALAAREFWGRCGTWVNTERALYLLALVNNATGDPGAALAQAEEALQTIASNGEERVDEAFIRLALADSYRLLGTIGHAHKELHAADALAAGFPSEGLKSWYADQRAKLEPGTQKPQETAGASAST
jgi:hypothetical protein